MNQPARHLLVFALSFLVVETIAPVAAHLWTAPCWQEIFGR